MTEPLHLTRNLTPQNQAAAATWLTQRMFGPGTIIVLMTAFQIGGLIAALLLSLATEQPFRVMLPIAIVAVFGASMAFVLFQNRVNRRVMAELSRSALRWRDHSLISFSRLDTILIPDVGLPAGITPETLAARITDWKA